MRACLPRAKKRSGVEKIASFRSCSRRVRDGTDSWRWQSMRLVIVLNVRILVAGGRRAGRGVRGEVREKPRRLALAFGRGARAVSPATALEIEIFVILVTVMSSLLDNDRTRGLPA